MLYDDWKRFPVDLLATVAFNVAAALILLPLSFRWHFFLIAWIALPALNVLFLIERKNLNHPDFPDGWPKRLITPYGSALALIHVALVSALWLYKKNYLDALVWILERIYG